MVTTKGSQEAFMSIEAQILVLDTLQDMYAKNRFNAPRRWSLEALQNEAHIVIGVVTTRRAWSVVLQGFGIYPKKNDSVRGSYGYDVEDIRDTRTQWGAAKARLCARLEQQLAPPEPRTEPLDIDVFDIQRRGEVSKELPSHRGQLIEED